MPFNASQIVFRCACLTRSPVLGLAELRGKVNDHYNLVEPMYDLLTKVSKMGA